MRSSLRFYGVIVASEQSVTLWSPLFDLMGNHVQVVLLAPDMLTSMMLVKGLYGDLSLSWTVIVFNITCSV